MRQIGYYILGLLFITSVSANAQVFEMDTLQWTGPAENRVNFVILGDGYLESELDEFDEQLPIIVDNIFTQKPFKEYRSFFNIIAVRVISNESGAALDPSNLIDNYFGSTYNYAGIDRLLVPTKSSNATSLLSRQFPQYDQIMVVVNHEKYGGSGGFLATSSIERRAPEIALHEIGHSFSDLRDEYWAGPQFAREGKNMTQETDDNLVKWRNWIDEQEIGIYAHNSDPSWKRPHQSCKMRYLGSDFCAVCKEATVEVIHDLVNTIDSYTPETSTLDITNEDSVEFNLSLVYPEPNTLFTEWFLNGELIVEDTADLKIGMDEFLDGENTLEAFVLDETEFSRLDDLSNRINMVLWTINKSISTDVQVVDKSIQYELYPNPASDKLILNLKGSFDDVVSASCYNVSGQLVLEKKVNNNQASEIDIRTLQPGHYILKLRVGSKAVSWGFIKV